MPYADNASETNSTEILLRIVAAQQEVNNVNSGTAAAAATGNHSYGARLAHKQQEFISDQEKRMSKFNSSKSSSDGSRTLATTDQTVAAEPATADASRASGERYGDDIANRSTLVVAGKRAFLRVVEAEKERSNSRARQAKKIEKQGPV